MMEEFHHIPVMLHESVEGLKVRPDGLYVDCTVGSGAHALAIAEQLQGGKLIANDRDPAALAAAGERLREHRDKVEFVRGDYKALPQLLTERGLRPDGILMDLGVSSYQLDTPQRGFSYMKDAPLDMRMDPDQTFSAYDVVNSYSEQELKSLFIRYGEEKLAGKIAAAIVRKRNEAPITRTSELSKILVDAYPVSYRGGHPAKRVFQAIRIEVNDELEGLDACIRALALQLASGGRMAVITFHSLEDRIVKNVFRDLESDCICDKRLPVCVCGKKQEVVAITRKPIVATEAERASNRRSESAKLRIVQRI